jgi:hypothetical protein
MLRRQRIVFTAQLKRLSGAAVLAALAAATAAPAKAASEAEQAEALIREGVKLRGSDNAAKALPLFEQAYQISRTPRTAAQLGLCELDLGYFVAAERYLSEALAAPDHPWVAKNKATLKKPLDKARASIGELSLVISPASAEVSLNHKPVDRALVGTPIRLDKGPVDIEVRAPGYEPASDTITIVGGKREQRTYTLVAQPVASAPAPGTTSSITVVTPPAPDPGAPVALSTAPAPAPSGGTNHRRIAAWVTGGAAVGALLLGTIEAFDAASKRDAFNNHTAVVGGVTIHDCGTSEVSPACKPLKDSYDRALTFSVIGFAAAAALAATSSVLFVFSSPNRGGAERDGVARAFGCVPDPVGRGLGCTLRF